jgi:hypothetical protein
MKNIKTYILVLSLIFTGLRLNAQSLTEGDNLVNISFGAGNLVRPQGFTTVIPPSVFQFEHAVTDLITIGGYLGYSVSYFEDENYYTHVTYPYFTEYHKYRWNAKNILFGAKATYHFGEMLNTTKKFDPYAGISIGYNTSIVTLKQLDGVYNTEPRLSPEPKGKFMLAVFAGARYYINEKIALFGEFGYSTAVLQLGITYKIPK